MPVKMAMPFFSASTRDEIAIRHGSRRAHRRDVFFLAVVLVARDVAGVAMADRAPRPTEGTPDALTLA